MGFKMASMLDSRKPHYWAICRNMLLIIHHYIKYFDQRPNYGPKSKFKMTTVRHLGILISPYRTTHEVFSLGYISLTNFVLIGYIVLKIWGFDFFAELAWNAYLRPKNLGFWWSGPLKIIDRRRDPQKAHLHMKPRDMSINSFDSVHICDL